MLIQLYIELATWKNYKIKGFNSNKAGLFEGSFFQPGGGQKRLTQKNANVSIFIMTSSFFVV